MELLQPTSLAFSGLSHSPSSNLPFCPWIIDNGATHHISASSFSSSSPTITHPISVNLPTGTSVNVTSTGDINLSPSPTFHNALCAREFKFNLISISQLTKSLNGIVSFFPNFCVFQDLTAKTLIEVGEERDDLYYFKPAIASSFQTTVSFTVWHRRLGHPSINNVPSFISRPKILEHCDSCARGKHTRLPFQLVSNKSAMPFERIYCDIWSEYHTASLCGAHYFLTIVNKFSRVTWLYLMRFKYDTLSCLKSFIAMVHNQFNSKVQHIQTDNGQEFVARSAQEFFSEHGILH